MQTLKKLQKFSGPFGTFLFSPRGLFLHTPLLRLLKMQSVIAGGPANHVHPFLAHFCNFYMNTVTIQRTLHAQEYSLEETPASPTNRPHYHRPFSYNSIHVHIKLSFKTGELINLLCCQAVQGLYAFDNLK